MTVLGFASMALIATMWHQPTTVTVQGQVVNRANSTPIEGAELELVGRGEAGVSRRTARTDVAGRFRMQVASAGQGRLIIRRTGFRPESLTVELHRDTVVDVRLAPLALTLESVRTRARVAGVEGHVVSIDGFNRVAGARVTVVGRRRSTTTDSTGFFRLADVPIGENMLLVSGGALGQVLRAVEVEAGRFRNETIVLTPDAQHSPGAIRDLEQRLAFRRMSSALVRGDAIMRRGGISLEVLQAQASVQRAGIRLTGGPTCVLLDGRPMPGWSVNALAAEDIEAVEVYGPGGDGSNQLNNMWPPAPCADENTTGHAGENDRRSTRWVVIWTRQRLRAR